MNVRNSVLAGTVLSLLAAGCAFAPPASPARPIANWTWPLCRGAVPVESAWDDELRTALAELRAAAWRDLRIWQEIAIAAVDLPRAEPRVCGRERRASITVPLEMLRTINAWGDRGPALRFIIAHELGHLALPDDKNTEEMADALGIYFLVLGRHDCATAAGLVDRLKLKRAPGHREHLERACAAAKRGERP